MIKSALVAILISLLSTVCSSAGTLTITASGFSTTSVGAPAGWPAGIVWPGSQSPNGSKSYTISDADWVSLMTWTAATQFTVPASPTTGAVLLAWVQVWVNGTKTAVAQFFTVPASIPPPIVIQ